MEFQVNAGQFSSSLRAVENVATKGAVKEFPSAGNITLKVKTAEIVADAFGGTCSITSIISDQYCSGLGYICNEEGVITVNGTFFVKAVNAFKPAETIIISANNQEVTVASLSDKDISQTTPLIADEVKVPVVAKQSDSVVTVNREVFASGLSKVNYAKGIEVTKAYYKCVFFEATNNKMKFVAGSGARFTINTIEGKNLVTANTPNISIIFPDMNIDNVVKVLGFSTNSSVVIKRTEATESTPDQIIIEQDGVVMVLLGLDPSLKYAEVDKILNYDYPNVITTSLDEWAWVSKGVDATKTPEEKINSLIHNSEITFKNDCINIATLTGSKANRKVPFKVVKNNGSISGSKFRCNSEYLQDIASKTDYQNCEIIIKFEDKDKPIFVGYPERVNETQGTVDNLSTFFATSKR